MLQATSHSPPLLCTRQALDDEFGDWGTNKLTSQSELDKIAVRRPGIFHTHKPAYHAVLGLVLIFHEAHVLGKCSHTVSGRCAWGSGCAFGVAAVTESLESAWLGVKTCPTAALPFILGEEEPLSMRTPAGRSTNYTEPRTCNAMTLQSTVKEIRACESASGRVGITD